MVPKTKVLERSALRKESLTRVILKGFAIIILSNISHSTGVQKAYGL